MLQTTLNLRNLVVEHCNGANNGSGIYLRTPAKAVLENVIVQNNLNGGISISANGAHAILHDVLISDNANKPGIFIYDSGIEIYNSEISDNDFGGISYTGVGYIPNTFEDVLFLNNGSSISNGGAINLHIQGANTNITNCTFYNNGGSSDVILMVDTLTMHLQVTILQLKIQFSMNQLQTVLDLQLLPLKMLIH